MIDNTRRLFTQEVVSSTPWTASNCLYIISLLKRGRFVDLADL